MYHLPYFEEVPYLYFFQTLFMLWMVLDCYRRGAEMFWFWIIFFVPLVGAWAYFLAVKVHDLRRFDGFAFWPFQSRPSLNELKFHVQRAPTTANNLVLAERLMEEGEHEAAIPCLEAVLTREPGYCQALYALAVCHAEANRLDQAEPLLQKNIARDAGWRNYQAWRLLVDIRTQAGNYEGALAACRDLVRLSPTLEHKCLLAEHLLEQGRRDEAGRVLDEGVGFYQYAPWSIKWRNRRWLSVARRMQKELERLESKRLYG